MQQDVAEFPELAKCEREHGASHLFECALRESTHEFGGCGLAKRGASRHWPPEIAKCASPAPQLRRRYLPLPRTECLQEIVQVPHSVAAFPRPRSDNAGSP